MRLVKGSRAAISRGGAGSRPLRKIDEITKIRGPVIDFGCGRGEDVLFLRSEVYRAYGYDPYWHALPDKWAVGLEPDRKYNTFLCTYVLNVLDTEADEDILFIADEFLAPGGTAYVSVRRDIPVEGKIGRGCFQRYVILGNPWEVFYEDSSFAIYKYVKLVED